MNCWWCKAKLDGIASQIEVDGKFVKLHPCCVNKARRYLAKKESNAKSP
jgi:hypothetical protein